MTSANAIAFSEHMQPFTPVLEAGVSDPYVAPGGVVASRWGRSIDAISYYGRVEFGEGCVPGEGTFSLSLPVRAAGFDAGAGMLLGRGYAVQASTGTTVHLVAHLEAPSTSYAVFDVFPGPGSGLNVMTGAQPWVWSPGDYFCWRLDYEGATW